MNPPRRSSDQSASEWSSYRLKTTSCASTPRRRSASTFVHGTPAVFTGQWTTRGPLAKVDAVGRELVEATHLLRVQHRAHRESHRRALVHPDLRMHEDLEPREASASQLLVRAAGAPVLVRVRAVRRRREERL